jgi:hypothetical protein
LSEPEALLPRARSRALTLYAAAAFVLLIGIAVLAAYAILLGPLTSPGAQASFGYALGLMSLMAAGLFHIADRTYRTWPLGRRVSPRAPGRVTDASQVLFLRVLIVVLAGAAIAYLVAGLLV